MLMKDFAENSDFRIMKNSLCLNKFVLLNFVIAEMDIFSVMFLLLILLSKTLANQGFKPDMGVYLSNRCHPCDSFSRNKQ